MEGQVPQRLRRVTKRRLPVKELLIVLGIVLLWIILNAWVLPRLGVRT